ncbi:alpha/beta fold hydrolase [Halarcobacter ebronensis]|uniref:Alpha/beta hydrolase n=1 Tax=Halarcobacter ebronensis TaxID=1462615 RepID=A0A4Q1AXJ7_9BACT|nr:alpha/beta hydrolase [Halarcobacter ebronensis]QKF82356.1 alpha/beta hydrolase family protein [Halarcobacter ebronensis]RXK07616.1 alpha/beta hydrolase [Halarcobacter ebronensis]
MKNLTMKTSDNVNINYIMEGSGKPLLLIPGWSCSLHFFDKNIPVLSKNFKVIAMDLRGHGKSDKPDHGYRISRFAMDIKELLDYLDLEDVTIAGWSMGASILWSYLELFGNYRVSKHISIDQSPAQYFAPDWKWGQLGCYDVESYLRLCASLTYEERASAEGTVYGCMHKKPTEEEVKFLADEIMECPARVKIDIMRDHTNLDWRDFIPYISIPTLVCVAKQSQVFPWQGSAWVGENIPNAKIEFFEDCGHMLFWDDSEKFNRVVADFILDN